MKSLYLLAFLFFSPFSFAAFTCVDVNYQVVTSFTDLPEASTNNITTEVFCFPDETSQYVGTYSAGDHIAQNYFPYTVWEPYRINGTYRSFDYIHVVNTNGYISSGYFSSSNISTKSFTPVPPNFSFADSVIDSQNPDPEPDPNCPTGDCEPNLCTTFTASVTFPNQTSTYPVYCAQPTPTAPVCEYFLSNVSGSTVTYEITQASDTCFSSGFVGNPTPIDDENDTPVDPDPTDPTDPDPTDPTDPIPPIDRTIPPQRNTEMNWNWITDANTRILGSIAEYSSRVQESINANIISLNEKAEFNNSALNGVAAAIRDMPRPNFDTQNLENAIQSQTNSLESSLTSTANNFLTNLGQLNSDLSNVFQTGFQSLSNSIDDLHDTLSAVSSTVNPEEAKSMFTALIPSNEIDIMQYLDHYETPYAASLRTCPAPISFELSIGTYEISLDFICQLAELLSYLLLALTALVCGRIIIS